MKLFIERKSDCTHCDTSLKGESRSAVFSDKLEMVSLVEEEIRVKVKTLIDASAAQVIFMKKEDKVPGLKVIIATV